MFYAIWYWTFTVIAYQLDYMKILYLYFSTNIEPLCKAIKYCLYTYMFKSQGSQQQFLNFKHSSFNLL